MEKIGKFEVIELLGAGAMGKVYRALDPLLGREVAVKVMTAQLGLDPELRARFFREASSAGSLQHPNIITVYELGEDDHERPFIAMELVSGRDLEDVIAEREPLSEEEKVDLLEQTCRGLSYAHEHGVIHRDVKPANIRVSDRDQVKIMDFGVARLMSSTLTRTGAVLGTPHYMAPEIIQGEEVDERADVFSVGATFYELLSYRQPFDGDTLQAVFHRIISVDPPALSELGVEVSPLLEQVLRRSLAKDPDDRYAGLDELLEDLAAYWETHPEVPARRRTEGEASTGPTRPARPASGSAADDAGAEAPAGPRTSTAVAVLALVLAVGGTFWWTNAGPGSADRPERPAVADATEARPTGAGSPAGKRPATGEPSSDAGGGTTGAAAGARPGPTEGAPGGAPVAAGEGTRPAENGEGDAAGSGQGGTGDAGPGATGGAGGRPGSAAGERGLALARRAAGARRASAREAGAHELGLAAWTRAESLYRDGLAAAAGGDPASARRSLVEAALAFETARRRAMDETRVAETGDAPDDVPGEPPAAGGVPGDGEEAPGGGEAPPAEAAEPALDVGAVVDSTLRQLKSALEAEDLRELGRIWTGLSPQQLRNFRMAFRRMDDLTVHFETRSVRRVGDRIRASLRTTYEFTNRSSGRELQRSFRQEIVLAPGARGWVIVESRGGGGAGGDEG